MLEGAATRPFHTRYTTDIAIQVSAFTSSLSLGAIAGLPRHEPQDILVGRQVAEVLEPLPCVDFFVVFRTRIQGLR